MIHVTYTSAHSHFLPLLKAASCILNNHLFTFSLLPYLCFLSNLVFLRKFPFFLGFFSKTICIMLRCSKTTCNMLFIYFIIIVAYLIILLIIKFMHVTLLNTFFFFFVDVMIFMHLTSLDLCSF